MNSITHAYSVVAFLLILGCTLMGFPLSVFSQSDGTVSSEIIDEQRSVQETATTTTIEEQVNAQEALATTSEDAEAPVASNEVVDSYQREALPSDQVFSDFVVGPGRFVLELEPGQSETVEMIISNRMGERKLFSLTTEDTAGTQSGDQAIVLLGEQEGPYTLRDYIHIPHEQFYLEHSQRVRVPVTVSLPADAEPGGRYGSLLVSIVSDPIDVDSESEAKPSSVVVSRIGTLFFVSTPGTIEHEGNLQKFSTVNDQSLFASGPISFAVVTENTGSVHLTPYGDIKIFNMVGSEVGSVELDPWFVMPQSLRVREVSWNRDFMLGRYTAVASISRGYDDLVDEQTFTFWVIPWMIIVPVFLGLFIFFLLLRFVFSQFEFKRKGK